MMLQVRRDWMMLTTMGVAGAVAAGQAFAEPLAVGEREVSVGAGVAVGPRYPGSGGLSMTPLPMIHYRQGIAPDQEVYVRGLGGGYAYQVSDRVSLGVEASYVPERDTDDDLELQGMEKVDATIEAGPKVRFQATPALGIEASLKADLLGANDGYHSRIGADWKQPVAPKTMLMAGAGVNYGSRNYNESYYGVMTSEARAGRPAYDADAGWSHVDMHVGAAYALTEKISLTGRVGGDYLLDKVADSPIVEQRFQPKAMLGAMYKF